MSIQKKLIFQFHDPEDINPFASDFARAAMFFFVWELFIIDYPFAGDYWWLLREECDVSVGIIFS
jgi:hypothetical protein